MKLDPLGIELKTMCVKLVVAEAELPIRQGGAAAPPTAGEESSHPVAEPGFLDRGPAKFN